MKRIVKKFSGTGDRKVLILSGIHGNELTPIAVTSEIISQFKVENFLPGIKILTIVAGYAEKAIKKNIRSNTFDPNREIENRKELSGLRKLILQNDIVIDLHASSNCSEFVSIDNDEYANKILNWCKSANVPYLIREFDEVTVKKYSLKNGKIGITMEMPGLNLINWDSVKIVISYITKLLSNLAALNDGTQNNIKLVEEHNSEQEGIIILSKKLGDFIEQGNELARIVDYEFNTLSTIKNHAAGFLLVGPPNSFVDKNECVLMFQPIIE